MKELQQEAKKLGINTLGKSQVAIKKEIEMARESDNNPSTENSAQERRTDHVERVIKGDRRGAIDPLARAKQIRKRWSESQYNPLQERYRLVVKNPEPGWTYYWPVNKPGRIEQLMERGYETVDVEGVSAGDNADGLKHILMRIPTVIYEELEEVKRNKRKKESDKLLNVDIEGGIDGSQLHQESSYAQINQVKVKLGAKTNQ